MKKALIALGAILLSATVTHAGEAAGIVSAIDMDARILILEDGTELVVHETVDLTVATEGDAVTLTTDDQTGHVMEITVGE